MSYERPNIQNMTGYSSGEQPKQTDVIKLNTNENPFPATKAVRDALASLQVESLRRYPQPLANDFRRVAAQLHGIEVDNIIATNGGDELLRLIITTFVGPGDVIAMAEPSYSLYPVLAAIQDCKVAPVPLQQDWSMGEGFAAKLNDTGAKLAFIVNPHAPSGYLADTATLEKIAQEFKGVLVIDEAYVDFIDPEFAYNAVPLITRNPNVIILRTMSKGYSLAGLRFAYGMGDESLISPMLYKTRDSYNTDAFSQVLATAALKDRDAASLQWDMVRAERARVQAELGKLGISCAPSQSNFLLAQMPEQAPHYDNADDMAKGLYQRLKDDGILVRYFDQDRLRDKLRITIGTFDENSQLLNCLQSYLEE
ncbi:MAG: histidinol-phosphate transaminase [Pseudohongiellaceae bacterium]|nr:histidinol-phosphate transaminase [Pseudohongiellaceae bacterium]